MKYLFESDTASMGHLRRFGQRSKLRHLREQVAKVGVTKEITQQAMDIYRRDSDLITKEDLTLFGVIVKRDK